MATQMICEGVRYRLRCERPYSEGSWFIRVLVALTLFGAPWAFDGTAAEVTVLHQFSQERSNGFEPQATMLSATDGELYGTTLRGGAHGQGILFRLSPKSKAFQVLHHFSLEKSNGRTPGSPLTEGKDGFLYGTTSLGGSHGYGTIFKVKKDGKAFTILHSFTGIGIGGDGRVPFAGVSQGKDSVWLGTTDEGGAYGYGTVYRLNADGTGYRVIYHFGGQSRFDGSKPRGTLWEGSDGKWYGTTVAGGRDDYGTVFVIHGDGSGYRVLHAFVGAPHDGSEPFGDLIEASDGRLYGTSVRGGRGYRGTIFRLGKDGTGYEVLRAFMGYGGEGSNPHAGLVKGKDGELYGVTLNGGNQSGGLIFRLASDGSGYKTLFAFSHLGHHWPYAGLTLGTDGTLYGTTTSGGHGRPGVVFRMKPDAQ